MLPKARRLSTKEVNQVYKSGRRLSGKLFTLIYVKNNEGSPSKFAVVASKKLASHAVDRNRLKRRTQAALRPLKGEVKSSYSLILSVRDANVATLPLPELTLDIKDMFIKGKFLKS